MGNLESPHFTTFLNVSNHAPFDAPVRPISFGARTLSHIAGRTNEEKLLYARHIHYADTQVHEMVCFLKEKYPDALFVFMGDHGNSKIRGFSSGRVPFILWNDQIIDNSASTAFWRGSQMDVLASFANIVLPNHTSFTSIGKPIWSDDHDRISVTHNRIITREGVRNIKGNLIEPFANTAVGNTSTPIGYAKRASAIEALSWGYLNSEYLSHK